MQSAQRINCSETVSVHFEYFVRRIERRPMKHGPVRPTSHQSIGVHSPADVANERSRAHCSGRLLLLEGGCGHGLNRPVSCPSRRIGVQTVQASSSESVHRGRTVYKSTCHDSQGYVSVPVHARCVTYWSARVFSYLEHREVMSTSDHAVSPHLPDSDVHHT